MTEQKYIKYNTVKQNVCLATIKEARDSRQMRSLAAYFFFKQHFYKAILYDYRSRMGELALLCGVSTKTLYTYIHHWKQWDIATDHQFNLVLRSTYKVKKAHREHRRKYQITTTDNENIETITARLNGKLLEGHAKKMNGFRKTYRFVRGNKKQAPPPSNDTKKTDCVESLPVLPAFSLSIRNTAKELNVGHVKAKEIIVMLNTLGVMHTIKTKARWVCKAPAHSIHATEGLPGHFFHYKGNVYQVFGNRHIFLEHSPNNDDLTYKQFMHMYRKSKATLKKVIGDIYINNATEPINLPH